MASKTLSKSKEECLQNYGWSSHLFFPKTKVLIEVLEAEGFIVDIGKTVIRVIKDTKKLKLYVHHNGRSDEYLTITSRGNELRTFHYTDPTEKIFDFISLNIDEN